MSERPKQIKLWMSERMGHRDVYQLPHKELLDNIGSLVSFLISVKRYSIALIILHEEN